jgi:hypothetical protein
MDKTQNNMETIIKTREEMEFETSFLESLSTKERKSYEIAKSHLGMSFDLVKSVGFIEWKKQKKGEEKKKL